MSKLKEYREIKENNTIVFETLESTIYLRDTERKKILYEITKKRSRKTMRKITKRDAKIILDTQDCFNLNKNIFKDLRIKI